MIRIPRNRLYLKVPLWGMALVRDVAVALYEGLSVWTSNVEIELYGVGEVVGNADTLVQDAVREATNRRSEPVVNDDGSVEFHDSLSAEEMVAIAARSGVDPVFNATAGRRVH